MIIKILGAESLGCRGLSCLVELKNRKICIDPGVALGWSRYGFPPHPFQVAVGAAIRENIIDALKEATDVVISHFDGDHCPLLNPNPYQLGIAQVKTSLAHCRIRAKGPDDCPSIQQERRKELAFALGRELSPPEGAKELGLEFSLPVPHGGSAKTQNSVMMTRIEEEGETFVHASDIQLLEEEAIEKILDWKPDIVLTSGPALYQENDLSAAERTKRAWNNALILSRNVSTLLIDHHLLRSADGMIWLHQLKRAAQNEILCAAEFMKREPLLLEAWRKELYTWLPAPIDWREKHKTGTVDVRDYRIRGWDVLIHQGKIRPCKWYFACPIKEYTERGKLERYWIENYCLVNNRRCIRYQMEEDRQSHPDNLLPDGKIRKTLE